MKTRDTARSVAQRKTTRPLPSTANLSLHRSVSASRGEPLEQGRVAARWETVPVAVPPASLEALVRDELRGPVTELVRKLVPQLVAEALNGSTASPPEHGAERASCAPDGQRPLALVL
jgi:hypothetical protein